MAVSGTAPRRRRPLDRREQILAAASHLFATRTYENVKLADIAEVVECRPSALYRHFTSKEDLLAAAVDRSGHELLAVVHDPPDRASALTALASFALDNRSSTTLWQRESRHLSAAVRAPLIQRWQAAVRELSETISRGEPTIEPSQAKVIAAAMFSVFFSTPYVSVSIPRPKYDTLLSILAERLFTRPLPAARARTDVERKINVPGSRYEHILDSAVTLFARRTFASVGMDEIAVAAAVAASSAYRHFPKKTDLLSAALQRASGYLLSGQREILATAPDSRTALVEITARHCGFALGNPDVMTLLASEMDSLPESESKVLKHAQREYMRRWSHVYGLAHPDVDSDEAVVVVSVVNAIAVDLARMGIVRYQAQARAVLESIAMAVIGVDPETAPPFPSPGRRA